MVARSVRRLVGVVAVLATAVLAINLLLPIAEGSPSTGSGTSVPDPSAGTPAALTAPFAERAGFDPAQAAAVSGVTPLGGSGSVVVVFAPRTPSFFAPPAPGAPALTPIEVGDEFGLSTSAYAAAVQYFTGTGLTVAHLWPDRMMLTLDGTDRALDRAFGTTVAGGLFDGRPVTFPSTAPTLPGWLEPEVASVVGLSSGFDTFTVPLAPSTSGPTQGTAPPVSPSIARNNLYGIAGLYNLTSSPTYASRESVAVLLWGDGYDPSDISTFYAQYYPSSYPAPTIVPYPVDGAPAPGPGALNDPDSLAPEELTLDIEWSGSMAAGATIDAVYAPDGPSPSYSPTTASMTDALQMAVNLDPAVISMSFGTAEGSDQSLVAAWQTLLAQAAQQQITVLAATGDLGGAAQSSCGGAPTVDYPSTAANVLAVGGTNVALQTNVLGQVTGFGESGWSGSTGGYSTQVAEPSWQVGAIPASQANGDRGVPDVSATAADDFVYYDGESQEADGTSFATPLWAGMIAEFDALHGAPVGFLTPRLYSIGIDEPSGRIGNGLADITSGSNCYYSAGPGWDAVTGWGSPRGVTLYEELTATFVDLSIAVGPGAVAPGGSVTVSAHLANETTGAPIPGVPVALSLAADVDLGPCVGSFGSATPVTDAQGNVSVAFAVPYCYLGSHAVAQSTVTSDGLYGVNSTRIGVDLLAFVPFLAGITSYPEDVVGFVAIMAIATAVGVLISLRFPRRRAPPRDAVASAPPPVPPAASEPAPAPPPAPPPAPSAPPPPAEPPPGSASPQSR